MTVAVLEPFKLGDFIQSTALLRDLRRETDRLVLAAARADVAEAAARSGLADETILLDRAAWEAGDPAGLPAADLLVNLSSAPGPAAMAARAEASSKIGPRLGEGGRIVVEPLQRLAAAVMAAGRRLGQINLVDLWRLSGPAGTAGTGAAGAGAEARLVWPLIGPGEDPAQDPARGPARDPACSRARDPAGERSEGPAPDGPPGLGRNGGRVPLVGLHLGCGHHLRRWPVERFVALAEALAPASIVLLGGPAERALAKRFLDLARGRVEAADLVGRTTLAALGRTLASLDLAVGADTSVAHLAAAVGAGVVGIFGGPAWAGETAPWSASATVVQGLGPCSPCREIDRCPRPVCPALPPVGPVARAAAALLAARGFSEPSGLPERGGCSERGGISDRNGFSERGATAPAAAAPDAAADSGGWDHVTLSSRRDGLGQTMTPDSPGPVDAAVAIGLALRAAGAEVLGLAGAAGTAAFGNAGTAEPGAAGAGAPDYGAAGSPSARAAPHEALEIVRLVAEKAFDRGPERARFGELAMEMIRTAGARREAARR